MAVLALVPRVLHCGKALILGYAELVGHLSTRGVALNAIFKGSRFPITTYTGKDMGWGGALHSLMAVPFMFLGELPLAP